MKAGKGWTRLMKYLRKNHKTQYQYLVKPSKMLLKDMETNTITDKASSALYSGITWCYTPFEMKLVDIHAELLRKKK